MFKFKVSCAGLVVALVWGTVVASTPTLASSQAEKVVEQARQECRSLDNGTLDVGEHAVTQVDITGDGKPDQVIDSSNFSCSSAASLFCGTGGCGVTVVTDGISEQFLAKDWNVVTWDEQPILLLIVHGSECGGNNLRRCYRATVWTESGFSTVGGN